MTLGERLQALADFVPRVSCVADIGTDHAYLSAELLESGRVDRAIATDVNIGPLEAARRTATERNLLQRMDLRIGNGLAPLRIGEAEAICIAGMGGVLISEILRARPEVCRSARHLILQPMHGAAHLRRAIHAENWNIAEERLAFEDGRIYVILKVDAAQESQEMDALDFLVGPCLRRRRPQYFSVYLEELLARERKALQGMERSARAQGGARYRDGIERLARLESLRD